MKPAALEWTAIGITARVVVTSRRELWAAREIAVEELHALDMACSRFRPDSEIAALASHAGSWTSISEELAGVLDCALRAARDTDGDVDPTMGADLSRLGYDRDFGEVVRVSPGSTTTATVPLTYRLSRRPTWRDIELETAGPAASGRRVRVPAGVVIDLGAIAKAWCADRCVKRIRDELSTGVLVSLGGDIATAGEGPDGGWLVRVQDRPGIDEGPSNIVVLNDGFALATSSTVSRAWQRGAARLHHILDPTTRRPADPVWRTVTVAAPSCVEANTASTASIVRGEAAPAWLASRKHPARLVDRRGVVRAIGGWPTERAAS